MLDRDLVEPRIAEVGRRLGLTIPPIKHFGPFRFFDEARAGEIAREELAKIGITVNHLRQKVGTMSGGERQSLAIARAEYRGARVGSHGLHYGSGVFEGIRAYDTELGTAIFRHDDHLDRLFRSAGLYHMPIPFTLEELRARLVAVGTGMLVDRLTEGVHRPVMGGRRAAARRRSRR